MKYTILEKDRKKYIIIGNRAIPFEKFDTNNIPIIKVRSKKTINKKGGKDIKVFVPVLRVVGKQQEIKK